MALFTPSTIFPLCTILLTCFAIQSKSIQTEELSSISNSTPPPTPEHPSTSGASIEETRMDPVSGSEASNGALTEEELSRNGTIRNRLFGFNFDFNLGGRQSNSYSSYAMAPYHQAIVTAYCRNLLTAISNARLPPTPPVVVIDPVVKPPTTNGAKGSSNDGTGSKLPPGTEEDENLQIQSRTLRCLRSSFRSSDPYSTVLNMCTTIVTTGRWN